MQARVVSQSEFRSRELLLDLDDAAPQPHTGKRHGVQNIYDARNAEAAAESSNRFSVCCCGRAQTSAAGRVLSVGQTLLDCLLLAQSWLRRCMVFHVNSTEQELIHPQDEEGMPTIWHVLQIM